MPEVKFKGQLVMRRAYKNEEGFLSGGSFFVRQVRDEDLGIFFNGPFLKSCCEKNNIRMLKPSEFEELEAEIIIRIPDKFIKKNSNNHKV
ncbi:TPA: hypothetical protein HA265_08185 [Candidatus Woesearchaeota archaeon]|nr:hypothetical protein [Candidatus Woesearchaeota archaeon]